MVGAGGASHNYCSGFKAFHRTTNTAMISSYIYFWIIHPTLYNNKLSRSVFSHHYPFLDWGLLHWLGLLLLYFWFPLYCELDSTQG